MAKRETPSLPFDPQGIGQGIHLRTLVLREHHETHAASASFPSPLDEAAVLTVDGVWEWAAYIIVVAKGNHERVQARNKPPISAVASLTEPMKFRRSAESQSHDRKLAATSPALV